MRRRGWQSINPGPHHFFYETVSPYLDHPPLFSLFIGGWLLLAHGGLPSELVWAIARVPMIALSAATLGATWYLAHLTLGRRAAWWVGAAFAFFPSAIVTARIIAAEHLIGLLLIIAMLCTLRLTHARGAARWWSAGGLMLVSLLAPWVKLTGLVVPLTALVYAACRQSWRQVMLVVAMTVASLAGVVAYGYRYNGALFFDLLAAHHERQQSLAHFWTLFTRLDIGAFPLHDPSIIVGAIGLLVLMADRELQQVRLLVFSALLASSFIFLHVAPVEFYGWYKYFLYPLLALGLGYLLWRFIVGDYRYFVVVLPLLGVMAEQAGVGALLPMRWVVVALYAAVGCCLLLARREVALRRVAVGCVVLLFLCEAVWSMQVVRGLPFFS